MDTRSKLTWAAFGMRYYSYSSIVAKQLLAETTAIDPIAGQMEIGYKRRD